MVMKNKTILILVLIISSSLNGRASKINVVLCAYNNTALCYNRASSNFIKITSTYKLQNSADAINSSIIAYNNISYPVFSVCNSASKNCNNLVGMIIYSLVFSIDNSLVCFSGKMNTIYFQNIKSSFVEYSNAFGNGSCYAKMCVSKCNIDTYKSTNERKTVF